LIGSGQFLGHTPGNLALPHLSHYLKIISPPRLWSAGLDPPLIRQQLLGNRGYKNEVRLRGLTNNLEIETCVVRYAQRKRDRQVLFV
jgi:hypothetical protein